MALIFDRNIDYILVDNDELIGMLWSAKAKKIGMNLYYFSHHKELIQAKKKISTSAVFFFDYDLNEEINGLDLAKMFYQQGHENLYITTGHEKLDRVPSYIKSVLTKNFPFSVIIQKNN